MFDKKKIDGTLDSRNFFVAIISIVLVLLGRVQEVEVDPEIAGEIYDAIIGGNISAILAILVPNLLNPVMKILKNGFNWVINNKLNFFTQLGTFVLMGVSAFGIMFPDGAVAEIVNEILGGNVVLAIVAIFINIISPVWHFFFDKEDEPVVVTEELS